MSDIVKRIVRCPYTDAAHYLADFLAQHRTGDGSTHVALRLPANVFAQRRPLLERRLCATLGSLAAKKDPQQVCSVTWSLPALIDELPEFGGVLTIAKCRDDDSFEIAISAGDEIATLSANGHDMTLFRRITQASARELLRTIAEYVENAWAHRSAARAGYNKPMQYAMLFDEKRRRAHSDVARLVLDARVKRHAFEPH
ncbi:MAG: hypothetical protein ABSB70_11560 [Candidatus Velthaea sp.]|jgi:hypothetical protein